MRSFDGPIAELVPHRASMLLLDRLAEDDAEHVRAEAVPRPDMLFADDAGLPAWVGVELMAQCVAAWGGLRRREAQKGVQLGFLLGTRKYESTVTHFPFGQRLSIVVRLELVAENSLAVFSCAIELGGQVVTTASLNVFQPEDISAYLKDTEP